MWEDPGRLIHIPTKSLLLVFLWQTGIYMSLMAQGSPNLYPTPFFLQYPDSIQFISYENIGILPDAQAAYSLHDILDQQASFSPYPTQGNEPAKNGVVWGHLRIVNTVSHNPDWVLFLHHPDLADIYLLHPGEKVQHKQAGRLRPREQKEISQGDQEYIHFTLPHGDTVDVYIRNQELGPYTPFIHLEVASRSHWLLHSYRFMFHQTLGNITFVAILLVMVLYHMMVYFSTWRKPYLHYSLYTLSLAGYVYFEAISVHYGLGNPILNQYLALSSLLLISIFYYQFARCFLQTHKLTPIWDRWISHIVLAKLLLIGGLLIYMYLTFDRESSYDIAKSMLFLDIPILGIFFWALFKTRSTLARYFIIASSLVFLLGISLFLVYNLKQQVSLLPFFVIFVVHILIFSLGLGYQLKLDQQEQMREKEEKLSSQEKLNKQLAGVNAAIGRFVPNEFIQSLGGKSVEDIQLGDGVEKENATVLFCDIRDYTSLAENMSLQENFQFLNSYLGRVGPIITEQGGFVNQYFGDGVMAIFLDSPDAAVVAAMQIQAEVQGYNKARKDTHSPPLRVGVGIHTGPLMMGIIGDHLRIEAGVVSDTVNTCSRMEGLTKHYGIYTLVSECTLLAMDRALDYQYRFLGRVLVKGRKEPIGVYDFFQGDPQSVTTLKEKSQHHFEAGLKNYYYRNFAAAAHDFHEVLNIFPTDLAAIRYLNYCEEFILEGIEDDWCGVEHVRKY